MSEHTLTVNSVEAVNLKIYYPDNSDKGAAFDAFAFQLKTETEVEGIPKDLTIYGFLLPKAIRLSSDKHSAYCNYANQLVIRLRTTKRAEKLWEKTMADHGEDEGTYIQELDNGLSIFHEAGSFFSIICDGDIEKFDWTKPTMEMAQAISPIDITNAVKAPCGEIYDTIRLEYLSDNTVISSTECIKRIRELASIAILNRYKTSIAVDFNPAAIEWFMHLFEGFRWDERCIRTPIPLKCE